MLEHLVEHSAASQPEFHNKFMGEIIYTKEELKTKKVIMFTETCSSIITNKFPKKRKDPDSFTIPCSIENITIKYALCDLEESVNLIPLSMFKKLNNVTMKPTKINVILVDGTIKNLYGIVEDVMVQAYQAIFLADFAILDI